MHPTTDTLSAADVTLYARVLQMADKRTFDTTLIEAGISSSSEPVRWATSLAVAQLGPSHREEALPVLRRLAVDRDTALAANASFGLGVIPDTASVNLLADNVAHGAAPVSDAAAWSLGEIGAPAAAALGNALSHEHTPGVTVQLLYAIAKIRPLNLAAVLPYLKSNNMGIRGAAVYAIARQGVPGGVRPVLNIRQGDAYVRSQMALALRRSAAGDSLQQPALQMLAGLLGDDYAQVRINAIYALASYGRTSRTPIMRATRDFDPNVRIAAAQAAAYVVGPDSLDWDDLWNADTSFTYESVILQSAMHAGIELPEMDQWRTRENWRYRNAFVQAWGASADTLNAKVVALIAAHDSDSRVRAGAYEVLVAMDPQRTDSVVQHALEGAVQDSDLAAREAVPWYQRIPTTQDSIDAERPLSWYENVVQQVVVPTLARPLLGATLHTDRGTIGMELLGLQAPLTVFNFISLARKGFYTDLRMHRVVPNFVAQDGDPRGDGNGGPGYVIRDELNREPYTRGAVGMATAGPNTAGSQYFLTLSPQPHLDGHYTLFGRVVMGLAAMDALVQGDIVKSITVP